MCGVCGVCGPLQSGCLGKLNGGALFPPGILHDSADDDIVRHGADGCHGDVGIGIA